MATQTAEQIATERVQTTLRNLARAERSIAENHRARRAEALADVQQRTAELFDRAARTTHLGGF